MKIKLIILLPFLLIAINGFSQTKSIMEFNFDTYLPDDTVKQRHNNCGPNWLCWNIAAKVSLNFTQSLQPKGSKGFLDLIGNVSNGTSQGFNYFLNFLIKDFNKYDGNPSLWKNFGNNAYISFLVKTGIGDTAIFKISQLGYDNVSDTVLICTNNKWSSWNIKLTDLKWNTSNGKIDLTKNPEAIYISFGNWNSNNNFHFSLDNIAIRNLSYKDTLIADAGDDKSIVCGDKKSFLVSTNYPDTIKLKYKWIPAVGLSSDSIVNPIVDAIENKKYFVTVTSPEGRITKDSVEVTVNPLTAKINIKNVNCGEPTQLNITTNLQNESNLVYKWSPVGALNAFDIKNPFVTLLSPTKVVGKVTTKNGCTAKDSVELSVNKNNFSEEICLVTVDGSSGRNKIVWVKTFGQHTKEYKVKKESTTGGAYNHIGTVPFSANSIFIDSTSDPLKHADRYILATVDSCGSESAPSNLHQTIHLAISQGLAGTYNLIWTPYIGFEYGTYYIYKGSSPANLVLIDSLANTYNQYTDTAKGVAFYMIGVKKESPCYITTLLKTGSEPISQSVSNLEDNLRFIGNAIPSRTFTTAKIYPNPITDKIVVETTLLNPSKVSVEVFNVLGSKIYAYSSGSKVSGNFKLEIGSKDLAQISNIAIIRLEVNGNVYYQKLVKE